MPGVHGPAWRWHSGAQLFICGVHATMRIHITIHMHAHKTRGREHISGLSPGARRPEHSPHPPGPDPPGPRAPGPAGLGAQGKLNLQPGPGPGPRPRPRWNGSFKGAGGVAGWYSWISLVSYPVDTRVNHTRDRSLTVAIYGYSPLPPGPEDWQEIHRPSCERRAQRWP